MAGGGGGAKPVRAGHPPGSVLGAFVKRAARRAVLAVTLACFVAVGCAKSQQGAEGVPGGTLAPQSTGSICDDPRGDISTDSGQSGGAGPGSRGGQTGGGTQPAGIDLVRAEAQLLDSGLRVTYTTAG